MKKYINEENEMFSMNKYETERLVYSQLYESLLNARLNYDRKNSMIEHFSWVKKLDDYAHQHWLSLQQDKIKQKSKLSVVKYGRNVK